MSEIKDQLKKERVIVALLDNLFSVVTAYILHKQGYEVTVISFEFEPQDEEKKEDSSTLEFKKIKKILENIGISHFTEDISSEYKEVVLGKYAEEFISSSVSDGPSLHDSFILTKLNELREKYKASFFSSGNFIKTYLNLSHNLYFISSALDSKADESHLYPYIDTEILKYALFPLGDLKAQDVLKIGDTLNLKKEEAYFKPGNYLSLDKLEKIIPPSLYPKEIDNHKEDFEVKSFILKSNDEKVSCFFYYPDHYFVKFGMSDEFFPVKIYPRGCGYFFLELEEARILNANMVALIYDKNKKSHALLLSGKITPYKENPLDLCCFSSF